MDAEQASADSTEKGAKYATQLIQRRNRRDAEVNSNLVGRRALLK